MRRLCQRLFSSEKCQKVQTAVVAMMELMPAVIRLGISQRKMANLAAPVPMANLVSRG
jgi:hypothetical protein